LRAWPSDLAWLLLPFLNFLFCLGAKMAFATSLKKYLRALLILGRVSNLPTVWSNCLAGWLLGDGGDYDKFLLLCLGATGLYLGGMFLNDSFDAEFDRQRRRERPIPSGTISERAVWCWGFGWLGFGAVVLVTLGKTTAMLALLLMVAILVYDAVHKLITFSPLLMAGCRFLLYLVAASVSAAGVTGLTIWSALVLGAYIAGVSYVALRESANSPMPYWPCLLLAPPLVLAYVVNADAERSRSLVLSALVLLWIVRCCRLSLWGPNRNLGRTVAGLLAGIVLIDVLAVAPEPYPTGLVFLLFLGTALLLQRFVPPT
jgi:hypothetical protein